MLSWLRRQICLMAVAQRVVLLLRLVVLLLLVRLAMVVLDVRVKVSRVRLRDVSILTRKERSII